MKRNLITPLISIQFAFALLCCCLAVIAQTVDEKTADREKEDGFVSMFNGKDLSEWEGNAAIWSVEDGKIVGKTTAEGPAHLSYNQFLVWKGEPVGDFVLRFDIKLSKAGNSGVQYRSQSVDDKERPYRVIGYQADFDGMHAHSGILYGEGFGGILGRRGWETIIEADRKPQTVRKYAENDDLKKDLKVEDWNSYEITAKGFTFTNKINDVVMSVCTDNDEQSRKATGIVAIQAHVGPPMVVELKNLRIKRLQK